MKDNCDKSPTNHPHILFVLWPKRSIILETASVTASVNFEVGVSFVLHALKRWHQPPTTFTLTQPSWLTGRKNQSYSFPPDSNENLLRHDRLCSVSTGRLTHQTAHHSNGYFRYGPPNTIPDDLLSKNPASGA